MPDFDSGHSDTEAGTVQNAFGTGGMSGSSVVQLSGAAAIAVLATGSSVQNLIRMRIKRTLKSRPLLARYFRLLGTEH